MDDQSYQMILNQHERAAMSQPRDGNGNLTRTRLGLLHMLASASEKESYIRQDDFIGAAGYPRFNDFCNEGWLSDYPDKNGRILLGISDDGRLEMARLEERNARQ